MQTILLHPGIACQEPRPCSHCLFLVLNPDFRRRCGISDAAIDAFLAASPWAVEAISRHKQRVAEDESLTRTGRAAITSKPVGPRCAHWGAQVGTVPCWTCGSNKTAPVHACAVHGRATQSQSHDLSIKACITCPDATPRIGLVPRDAKVRLNIQPYKPSPISVRNLVFHLYPVAHNGVWQWNIAQLMKRIQVFNGKRYVGIVTDQSTSPVEEVKAAFHGEVDDFVVLPNDRSLREVKTFLPLFDQLEKTDQSHITFYCHGKGIRHDLAHERGTTATIWAEIMYEANLDYWPEIERLFQKHPCVGALKKVGRAFGKSPWHYTGSFFWFHNASLFARNWQYIDQRWWGIEPMLSLNFTEQEAGCVFWQGVTGDVNDGNREHAMKANHLDMYDWTFCQLMKERWEKRKQNQSPTITASAV